MTRTVLLGDVAVIERTVRSPEKIESGTLYVGLENIERGGEIAGVGPVDAGELGSAKFDFTDRHILYGKLRPYLAKIALPSFHGICSTDIVPILPGNDVDRRYLCRFLRQPEMVDRAASRSVGANLPRLSPSELARFPVPLPPMQEQRRIAAVLDQADEVRAKRRASLAILSSLTESIFLDISRHADGAPRVRLGDVAAVQGGLQVTRLRAANPVEVPYLRVANVHRGSLDLSEVKTLMVTELELARTVLERDDLLVVEGHGNPREIGRVARWTGAIHPCVHQNHLIRARVDGDRADAVFVEAFLNSRLGRQSLLRAANTTSGLNTISTGDVKDVSVPLPPIAAQKEFAAHIRRVVELEGRQSEHLRGLGGLFASLQHRAFSGAL